jgi:hypothetical protein
MFQPLVDMSLVPDVWDDSAAGTIDIAHLAAFLDPSLIPLIDFPVVVEPDTLADRGRNRYNLLRVADSDPEATVPIYHDRHRPPVTPLGTIEYDPALGFVTAATVDWSLWDLEMSGERLLYERHFHSPTVLTVHYQCTAP